VHGYYGGTSSQAPAREVIESDLIEAFHWLPQDIDNIPYKKLQTMFLVRREKQAAIETKRAVDQIRAEHSQTTKGRGQTKRYREL